MCVHKCDFVCACLMRVGGWEGALVRTLMCMECLNGCGCLRALVCVGVGGPVCVLVLHGRVCPLVGGYGVAARCACLLVGMMWVRGVHACRKV